MSSDVEELKKQAMLLDYGILQVLRKTGDKKKAEALEQAADLVEHQVIECLNTAI
jgi:hypothetical protein